MSEPGFSGLIGLGGKQAMLFDRCLIQSEFLFDYGYGSLRLYHQQ
jgi:hypothetical protein